MSVKRELASVLASRRRPPPERAGKGAPPAYHPPTVQLFAAMLLRAYLAARRALSLPTLGRQSCRRFTATTGWPTMDQWRLRVRVVDRNALGWQQSHPSVPTPPHGCWITASTLPRPATRVHLIPACRKCAPSRRDGGDGSFPNLGHDGRRQPCIAVPAEGRRRPHACPSWHKLELRGSGLAASLRFRNPPRSSSGHLHARIEW